MATKIKKTPIISRYVHEQLFNADVVLVLSEWKDFLSGAEEFLTEDKMESLKEMVEKHGEDPHCLATQFPFAGGGSIIWANPSATVGTLLHEVVHAAFHLLKKRATPLSEDSEETYAYLVEFLFNSLTKSHGKKR